MPQLAVPLRLLNAFKVVGDRQQPGGYGQHLSVTGDLHKTAQLGCPELGHGRRWMIWPDFARHDLDYLGAGEPSTILQGKDRQVGRRRT